MPRTNYAKRVKEAEKKVNPIEKEDSIEEIDEVIEEKPKAKKVEEVKKFSPDDYITCRSVTVGGLTMPGVKSNDLYRWTEYGDTTEVAYKDLASLVRSKSEYVFHPYIVIEDDDFINEFAHLKQFYDDSYTVEDLEGVLALSVGDMVATINTLPNGAKETLKNIASTQIADGRLDSVKKIKALDEIFDTDLNLFASMFD